MDIIIENLCKRYEEKIILNNYNNIFKEKTISFILGTSGIGKTTLIKILMGLEKADDGKIKGIDNKQISVIFQEDSLCENLSVLLNIKLVCENIRDDEIKKELLLLGLEQCENTRIRDLSGGMKRRVSILRALLYKFDLLIMDEPFKGLDKKTKEKVMSYVIKKVKNKTVIIITHDIQDIDYFKNNTNLIINEYNM